MVDGDGDGDGDGDACTGAEILYLLFLKKLVY